MREVTKNRQWLGWAEREEDSNYYHPVCSNNKKWIYTTLDVTATLAYLEGNVNFLLQANDRHSDTAQESLKETTEVLHALRMKMYKKSHHNLLV